MNRFHARSAGWSSSEVCALKVGLDGFLLEQLGAQPALHGAGLDARAQVPHRLDALLRLVHGPVALDDLRGERDEHDRGRGVQARQLREPVIDQAEQVIEPVEPLQPVGGQVADLAGRDLRLRPVRPELGGERPGELEAAERVVLVIAVDALGRAGQPGAGFRDALGGADEAGGHRRGMVRLVSGPRARCRDADLGIDVGEPGGEGQFRLAEPLDRRARAA